MNRSRISQMVSCYICMSLLAAGCSSPSGLSGTQTTIVNTPQASNSYPELQRDITLSLYNLGGISQEKFNEIIGGPVKKKFPNVTLTLVNSGGANSPENLLSTDSFPDIVYVATQASIPRYLEMGVFEDLNPQIKKYAMDLSRFEANGVQMVRKLSGNDKMYALPFYRNPFALYYNKDLFDKFAVPYPADGMKWEDVIELSRKIGRTHDGKRYRGMDVVGSIIRDNQLSLPVVDPSTNKALVNSDGWKRFFTMFRDIFSISQNIKDVDVSWQAFVKNQDIAMLAWPNLTGVIGEATFAWDVTTLPVFSEKPRTNSEAFSTISVSSTSKNKEAAFQLVSYLLTEEMQTLFSRTGLASVLNDKKINEQFGLESPYLKDKNRLAFVKLEPAVSSLTTSYDLDVIAILNKKYKDVIVGKKDVNTALREAEEEANKFIAEHKK
jgi:multiple sugar transport system substrate-binding protein